LNIGARGEAARIPNIYIAAAVRTPVYRFMADKKSKKEQSKIIAEPESPEAVKLKVTEGGDL
jgi:hypothetical protein